MNDVPLRLATALSHSYRIERELGAGGMATVYLAQDLKHDRKVAIKVLRPELAAVIGAERFLSEIKTTANLQHPHILALHDSGEADLFLFYVMPYVEGESLRDRLTREKQLPINDAVRIATEVAGALDYAHRHAVIHRDIKPENILLHDGRALVADFGIALAASSAGSRMTETGMSLGTPTYMSPEQAMGERTLDARTDVYALGCVLYEMLTGEPPFTGPTAQSIVAKVMSEKPVPPSKRRSAVREHIDDTVLTALEKLPADRFATPAEFASALAGASGAHTGTRSQRAAATAGGMWRRVSAGLGVLTLGLLAVTAWALSRGAGTAAGPAVYDAALPDTAVMSFYAVNSTAYGFAMTNLSVSADGAFAVYTALRGDSTMLWYRNLRDAGTRPIDGTAGASAGRISPDGTRVAFLSADQIMVAPIGGGTPRRLLIGGLAISLEWASSTRLLAIHTDGYRMSWLDPEVGEIETRAIPRCVFGRWIVEEQQLICSHNGVGRVLDPVSGNLWLIRNRNADGSAGSLVQGSMFRIVDGRYLVYLSQDGDLRAAPYDRTNHLIGRGVTLTTGVRREALGAAQFDLSPTGSLLYAPGINAEIGRLVQLNQGGTPRPFPIEPAAFQRYDLSRDRRWLAAVVQLPQNQELRIYDLKNGQSFSWIKAEYIRHPLWSREGARLLVRVQDSTRVSIVVGSPASAVALDTVYRTTELINEIDPIEFHDDHTLLAQDRSGAIVFRFDPTTRPVRFDTIAANARFPMIAPGGKRLAYQTTDAGRVMVTTYPPSSRRLQAASVGVEPLWISPTQLLYRTAFSWYQVRFDPATGDVVGVPTLWGTDPRFSDTSGWSNRPSHDGGIIYVQGPEQSSGRHLRVIPNWVAGMRAAVDSVNR